ncbi:proton-coupled amino acid transporter 1-like, partial [Saccoglossus kowalevskii]
MGLLADCSHHLCKKTKSVSLDYGEVAYEATHLSAAKRFNSYANIARITVNTFLFFSQLVFCSIYIIFISDNIQQIYIQFHPNHTPVVQVFMVILTIVILLISYIKNLDALAIYSAIGNLILIVGSVIVFEYLIAGIVENKTDISSLPLFDTVANFPIFFGTAVFSYEGIGVVLPVENKMKHPRHFKKTLHISMAIVTILYIFMGTLGYMRFGLDVKDTITLNLPQDQGLYISVRIMLSLVLVVSYAIQFYVPIQ